MASVRLFFGPYCYWRVGSQAWCVDEISLNTGVRQESLHYGLHSFAYEIGKGLVASVVFLLLGTYGKLETCNCMDVCEKKAGGMAVEGLYNINMEVAAAVDAHTYAEVPPSDPVRMLTSVAESGAGLALGLGAAVLGSVRKLVAESGVSGVGDTTTTATQTMISDSSYLHDLADPECLNQCCLEACHMRSVMDQPLSLIRFILNAYAFVIPGLEIGSAILIFMFPIRGERLRRLCQKQQENFVRVDKIDIGNVVNTAKTDHVIKKRGRSNSLTSSSKTGDS